mgnify:FL=1
MDTKTDIKRHHGYSFALTHEQLLAISPDIDALFTTLREQRLSLRDLALRHADTCLTYALFQHGDCLATHIPLSQPFPPEPPPLPTHPLLIHLANLPSNPLLEEWNSQTL